MKKIINAPEAYTDDMCADLRCHPDMVKYVEDDLRCYCTAKKKQGKVAIITGGGTGHLPLFLGYVGENLLDGCGVGGVVPVAFFGTEFTMWPRKWRPGQESCSSMGIIQGTL